MIAPVESDTSKPRRIALIACLTLIPVLALVSVNVMPVFTNDSLTYLGFSDNLTASGLVVAGYRQFGFPLFLESSEFIARLIGVESTLFAVLVQRILLLAGLAYAIWLWRWWSIPVVALVLSAHVIAYTNFILTEGLSIPLALILCCLVAHFLRLSNEARLAEQRLLTTSVAGAIGLVAFGLLTIRFPFFVFGVCPLVVAFAARKTVLQRPTIVVLGLYLAASFGVLALISAENLEEYGEFSPSTRGARAEYWAAWMTVFWLNPENQAQEELEPFYGGGSPYEAIREIESLETAYADQARRFETLVDHMLTAAGLDSWTSRLAAFAGAISGGRLDDLRSITANVATSGSADIDEVMYRDAFSESNGPQAFADRYNEGVVPDAIVMPLAGRLPVWKAFIVTRVLLPIALLIVTIGIFNRRSRLMALAALGIVVGQAGMIAYIRADNFRYLLTTTLFGVASMSAVLVLRSETASSVPLSRRKTEQSDSPPDVSLQKGRP